MHWERGDGIQLPEHHDKKNGTLVLYNVGREDAGKYICLGMGTGGEVLFSKTANLRIIGEYATCIGCGINVS